MKYLATLVATLMLLTVVGVAPAMAHSDTPTVQQWNKEMNQPTYWENRFDGFDCRKIEGRQRLVGIPEAKYKTIVKGATWVNIYHRLANPPHVHTPNGDRDISWTTICSKRGDPRGPEAAFFGKAYGPKGDPWYRFTFWNRGETTGTCFVKVNGDTIFKKRINEGYGFKTGWRFIPGYSKVNMACWSGGKKVWGKRFTAAAPGYYGPLYYGYTKGYFRI